MVLVIHFFSYNLTHLFIEVHTKRIILNPCHGNRSVIESCTNFKF